jgi:hypothetical protein
MLDPEKDRIEHWRVLLRKANKLAPALVDYRIVRRIDETNTCNRIRLAHADRCLAENTSQIRAVNGSVLV